MGKGQNIWVERCLILSKAFQSLTATAIKVLMIFYIKRQMESVGRRGKKQIRYLWDGFQERYS